MPDPIGALGPNRRSLRRSAIQALRVRRGLRCARRHGRRVGHGGAEFDEAAGSRAEILHASKRLLVAGLALTLSLVALCNMLDPAGNLDFVRHVIAMDTLPAGSAIRSRYKPVT